MPPAPAYCDLCKVFFPSPISVEGGVLLNNTVSCPRGHTARVVDGFYRMAGDTLFIESLTNTLQQPGVTRDDLRELEKTLDKILSLLDQGAVSPEDASEVLEAEAPSFQGLGALLRKANEHGIWDVILLLREIVGFLLMTAGLVLGVDAVQQYLSQHINIESGAQVNIYNGPVSIQNTTVNEATPTVEAGTAQSPLPTPTVTKRIPRNKLCPCGSGIKHKYCCYRR